MSDSNIIVLFDIPGGDREHTPWSPNTWKARYTLNYKGLPYRTEWVEYPDVEATCIKYGAPPTSTTPDGRPHYTFPIIYDPSTKSVVADSAEIAKYLDKTYSNTPKLFPEGTQALQSVFLDSAWPTLGGPLFMNIMLPTSKALSPRSGEYFRRTREALFGKKLEELGGESDWKLLEAGFDKVASWLGANGAGKDELFLGDRICFADLQLVAYLTWAKALFGEDSDNWKRIASWHGGKWKRLIERFDKYAAVDL